MPSLGHDDGPLAPEITSSWIAVCVELYALNQWILHHFHYINSCDLQIIFLISGLGVKTEEMKKASLFWRLNLFVHFFIYIYHPLLGAAVANALKSTTNLSPKLLDGLIIALCLPTTISSAVVLTVCSNGNEAAAIINCTIANVLGIGLTPALIFIFLGNLGNVDIAQIFLKLALRVVVPVKFCF